MLNPDVLGLTRIRIRGACGLCTAEVVRGLDLCDIVPGVVVHGGIRIPCHGAIAEYGRCGTRLHAVPDGRVDGESGNA